MMSMGSAPQGTLLMWVSCAASWGHADDNGLCCWWGLCLSPWPYCNKVCVDYWRTCDICTQCCSLKPCWCPWSCAATKGHIWIHYPTVAMRYADVHGPCYSTGHTYVHALCFHLNPCWYHWAMMLLGVILMWVACITTWGYVCLWSVLELKSMSGIVVLLHHESGLMFMFCIATECHVDSVVYDAAQSHVDICGVYFYWKPCWFKWPTPPPEAILISLACAHTEGYDVVGGSCHRGLGWCPWSLLPSETILRYKAHADTREHV